MLNHPVFVENGDIDPLFISVAKNVEVVPEKAFVRYALMFCSSHQNQYGEPNITIYFRLLCEMIYNIFQRVNATKLLMNRQNKNKIWKHKLLSEFILLISYMVKSGKL